MSSSYDCTSSCESQYRYSTNNLFIKSNGRTKSCPYCMYLLRTKDQGLDNLERSFKSDSTLSNVYGTDACMVVSYDR